MDDQAKFCGTCGAKLPAGGGFCGACGTGTDPEVLAAHPIADEQPSTQSNKGNKKAIWSLVTGILGLFIAGLLLGAIAIYLSQAAKKEIAVTGEGGAGMATAGLVLGIFSIVGSILWRLYA